MRRVLLILTLVCAAQMDAGEVASPVPANAKWIIHVATQRVASGDLSPIVQRIAAQREPAKTLAEIQKVFGVHLLTDLTSVTLFGVDSKEENVVIAIRGKFDSDRLVAMVSSAQQHTTKNYAGRTIHTWMDENKGKKPVGCIVSADLLLVGNSDEMIQNCIDTFDAKTPGVAIGSDLNTVETLGFCAVRDLQSLQGADPKAAILQKVTELRAHIDAKDRQFIVFLEAKTLDEAAAKNVKSVAEGLRALAVLNAQEDQHTAAIVDKVQIQGEGKLIKISVSIPVEAATAWLEDRVKEANGNAAPNVLATPAPGN